MICPNCGSPIGKKDEFCRRCGRPVSHEMQEKNRTPRGILVFTIIMEVAALTALVLFLFFASQKKNAEGGNVEESGTAAVETVSGADGTEQREPPEMTEAPMPEPTAAPTPTPTATPTPEPTATPTPEPTATPTPEPTEPPMPEMTADEVENSVELIRAKYNDIIGCIDAGLYYEENPYDGLTVYRDFDGLPVCVIASAGYHGSAYTRYLYYDENGLFFAYYEAYDAHRFYFKNGRLFRWRYCQDCMVPDEAVNFDLADTNQYRGWEGTVKSDAEEFWP